MWVKKNENSVCSIGFINASMIKPRKIKCSHLLVKQGGKEHLA